MAAPNAHFDDSLPILRDLNTVSEKKRRKLAAPEEAAAEPQFTRDDDDMPGLHDRRCPTRKNGIFSSTGDLVNEFDKKLAVCFQPFNEKTDSTASMHEITENSLLGRDKIWNALTSNYGHVMPMDWKQSQTFSLYNSTFKLEEKPRTIDIAVDLSDYEELREQLDMHSIIVSYITEEPLFTAEQVMEEIEEMMKDSPDMEEEPNASQSDLSMLSMDIQRASSSPGYERSMRTLNVAGLNERLEEIEMNIGRFSEVLVQQLALRDELEFEKEVKNSFISALIDVQNRQKEHRERLKRKKLKSRGRISQGNAERTIGLRFSMGGISSVIQDSFRQTFRSGCSERQYLTTAIPYEKTRHPPSLQDLQILTKILQAMSDNSDKVPSLLTDYILKVLCPS